jgi:hypothetical protein
MKVLHVAGEKVAGRQQKMNTGDIPLPRSLSRYARSFGCGERYRQRK